MPPQLRGRVRRCCGAHATLYPASAAHEAHMRLMTRATSVHVCGSTTALRTRGASWGVAATRCSYRCVSSGSSQHQQHHVAADELRAALRTLGLAEESTDAEVKRAFQAFAIQHHPDANAVSAAAPSSSGEASSNTRSQSHAAERMRLGTEAYQLLRRIPYGVRQNILRGEGQGGGVGVRGRFRGPHDANFTFTAEEYAKVQRIYQGDRHRRQRHRSCHDRRGGAGDGDGDEDLFDARTEEGRRRIARLNEFQARVVEMRRRGIRDDLPPWRVYENDKGAGTAGDGRSASTSGGNAGDGHQGRHGSRAAGASPRNTNRLGLHFFNATTASLREVRDLYRSRPGFAGMDGSSYDNPHSAARVAPEISSNPHLRQYILMKNRAQEKAIVDRAVGRPLLLFLLLASLSAAMVMMAATVRSYRMRMQKDEDLRQRDEERGGA